MPPCLVVADFPLSGSCGHRTQLLPTATPSCTLQTAWRRRRWSCRPVRWERWLACRPGCRRRWTPSGGCSSWTLPLWRALASQVGVGAIWRSIASRQLLHGCIVRPDDLDEAPGPALPSLPNLPFLTPPANGSDSGSNAGEAQLVLRFLQAAAAAGVAQEQLGVISPYRAQVRLACCVCACWLSCNCSYNHSMPWHAGLHVCSLCGCQQSGSARLLHGSSRPLCSPAPTLSLKLPSTPALPSCSPHARWRCWTACPAARAWRAWRH